jgi:hypothetical protein
VFPYNIFTYCSICREDRKFARNKEKKLLPSNYSKLLFSSELNEAPSRRFLVPKVPNVFGCK